MSMTMVRNVLTALAYAGVLAVTATADLAVAKEGKNVTAAGCPKTVRIAVAWSTDPDAGAAGKQAAEAAIAALKCPVRAVVFYTYYQDPDFVPDEASQATACKADVEAEQAVAKAIAAVCGTVPNIGCRARCLTNGGTLLKNAVGVMAIGGEKAAVAATAVPILDDRRATGKQIAEAMTGVKDLSLIIALAEMRLSFETKDNVSVEDFIRGVVDNSPQGVTLFGGNSMPDDMAASDLAGAQFYAGKPLKGYVVALGIGGPIKAFGNHTNEFRPSEQTVTVTETNDKWIITLDEKPAMDVYRELRGMADDEELTSDWQHPIGVVVGENKQYLRMILNWIDAEGKDKDGKASDLPPGSLCFVAPVVKGTKIKILAGGDDAAAIVATAKQGISETMQQVRDAGAVPVVCLLSNCCARGMRLRTFRKGNDDEVPEAIIPAMGKEIPLFGFYAWGELGRICGQYEGLSHQYQQHTFVSTVLAIAVPHSRADRGSCGPVYTGNGLSRLTDAKAAGIEAAQKAKTVLGDQKAALVLVYDSDGVKDKAAVVAGVAEVFDASIVYGCPGYGPITQDGNDGTVGVLALAAGYADVATTLAKRDGDHAVCGKQIGQSLKAAADVDAPGKLLLLFGDCHVPADDDLVKGACSVLGEKFPAIGGSSKGGSVYYQGKVVPNANIGILITGNFEVGLSLKKDMSPEGLITSASDAFTEAMGNDKDHVALMFVFDCGGRRGKLGPNTPKELTAMKDAAGKTPIFGFYGSGEIGHTNNGAASCGVGYSISACAIIVK